MNYKIYYNGDKVKFYGFTVPISTIVDHGDETDDEYANNYISNLGDLSLAFDGDDLEVSFEPCTDQELLSRVAAGKTRVRLQLLVHKVSACGPRNPNNNGYWHCLELWHEYYDADGKPGVRWARTKGRGDSNTNTYIDLTANQLSTGYAKFIDARCHAHGTINNKAPICYDYISVELFCPALYRHNKDIYYYEREDGIYYVADNCVSAVFD